MIKKLKTLKALLGQQDLILTGSNALAYHGLMELSEAKDIDLILVKASATSLEILNRFQSDNPSPRHKDGSPVNYSFIYEGVKVDVWLIPEHEEKSYLLTEYGIKVASIKSIVKAKMSYNRSKDWIQLMKLASKIYDADKFKSILSTIKTDSDDYLDNA